MTKDYLLEVGLEEMPAHVVTPSREQLAERVAKFLADHALPYRTIDSYATPRRLAVIVRDLADKQADETIEAKGPAKKIAQAEDGTWSKAAEGFVRGQGLTTDDIFYQEIKGVEYAHIRKEVKGLAAETVLPDIIRCVTEMTFPVSMHWGTHSFKYIRPIHWLVSLLDDKIIPLELLNIQAGRTSRGHRFLGQTATIAKADAYEAALAAEFVYVDPAKRKELIAGQIETLAKDNAWKIDLDAGLLEEVTNLVEYPTAFVGNFAEKYLAIPEEVLVTSMKEHQRYFDVRNANGALLPHFVSVRNGNAEHLENVRKGNEKVLTARLEDAEFFYQEDQKLTIAGCVERLAQVTFHEKIGSMTEKMARTSVLAQVFGQRIGLTAEELADLERASAIYKFDLVTNMVGEFPELQGIMGEKYALLQGEKATVAQAIREHYYPISSEGVLPSSRIGAVLAIADKVDSLLSFSAAGMVPKGSNDPYALRRQTYGIIRILEAHQWAFNLVGVVAESQPLFEADPKRYGKAYGVIDGAVLNFVKGRVKQWLLTKGTRHDVVEAVLASGQENVTANLTIADVLQTHLQDEDFKGTVEAFNHVLNLAKKAEASEQVINPELFENAAEENLYQAAQELKAQWEQLSQAERFEQLRQLRPAIERYFADTMVMAEDVTIRQNRLRLLVQIARMILTFADTNELMTK